MSRNLRSSRTLSARGGESGFRSIVSFTTIVGEIERSNGEVSVHHEAGRQARRHIANWASLRSWSGVDSSDRWRGFRQKLEGLGTGRAKPPTNVRGDRPVPR